MIAGLVLAAGEGSRFGHQSKLLADLAGRPLLEHAIAAQCEVGELDRVAVVLGAQAEEILARARLGRAVAVIAADWATGQSASLRTGLARVFDEWEAEKAIVTLGDQPLINPAVIRRFVSEPPGVRAVYGGRPGHPVVLGPEHYRAIAEVTGDRGARDLLRGGRTIECGDVASGLDVDTPGDLRHAAAKTSGGGPDANPRPAREHLPRA